MVFLAHYTVEIISCHAFKLDFFVILHIYITLALFPGSHAQEPRNEANVTDDDHCLIVCQNAWLNFLTGVCMSSISNTELYMNLIPRPSSV